ncbi:hypothetical protein [Breoghania sp. L-A4]|uniref:hypothetical protein n=1 Tax=Breoghania sp. L-A4 TaxID=2304600 RepID=UPI000E35F2C6|nr:hypothetical protein [Breoghania sp. L-A4]AXS39666.1 hypothetical protein D1F64_05880 [Breoghania sp. L-A4]
MLAATVAACLVPGVALSDDVGRGAPPDGDDAQRYTMSETSDGFLRLDRKTGAVSLCKGSEDRWSCVPVPDAQVALDADIYALEQENERLIARVSELEARLRDIASSAETELPRSGEGGAENAPSTKPRKEPELTESEKRQIDKFVDFSEHAMRRFFGFMKTMREEYEKGL